MAKNSMPPLTNRNGRSVPNRLSPQRLVTNSQMEFYFFNVGQGECTLIRLPNGKWALIDFGSAIGTVSGTSFLTSSWSKQRDLVISEIIRLVPSMRFEWIILTHADDDHYNKLMFLINPASKKVKSPFTCDNLYISSRTNSASSNLLSDFSRVGAQILRKKIAKNIKFVNINDKKNYVDVYNSSDNYTNFSRDLNIESEGYLIASDRVESIDGDVQSVSWEVFIMAGNVTPSVSDESIVKNSRSIVTLFRLNSNSLNPTHILLRGDATDYTDRFLLSKYSQYFELCTIDLGNIAHHGSGRKCNAKDDVSAFVPMSAIVSCARENVRYSHPDLNAQENYLSNNNTSADCEIEGFVIRSDKVNGKFYYQQVVDTWRANGVLRNPQQGVYRNGVQTYYRTALPFSPNDNSTEWDLSVSTNYKVYRKKKIKGDIFATFKANSARPDADETVYIEKTFICYPD